MPSFNTLNRHGYSVKFSPFSPTHLAVAASENYGMMGRGTLFILKVDSKGSIQEIDSRHWPDGFFDIAWSKKNLNHILSGSADGSLQLWDLNIPRTPIKTFLGHRNEVSSVDWSHNDFILSASWDTLIKLWDMCRSTCVSTFLGSTSTIYEATFSTYIPNLFASVSRDGSMKLWNILNPKPAASFRVHDSEVLSCDWCTLDSNLIATCGSDSFIRGWDIRNYKQPIFQFKGGSSAVRRIRFSPHYINILASVSFDCATKIWDFRQNEPLEDFKHHSEFVYGLDWNCQKIAELADCSWDNLVRVFTSDTLRNIKNKM